VRDVCVRACVRAMTMTMTMGSMTTRCVPRIIIGARHRGARRGGVGVEAHGVYGNDRRLMTTSSSSSDRARVGGWWWWSSSSSSSSSWRSSSSKASSSALRAQKSDREREIDAVTKKWGLEAGLWNVFKSPASSASASTNQADKAGGDETDASATPSRMDMAKALLKRYGSAYLFTSISLSLVSITVFYFLVAGGVDVAGLLEKVGINVNATSESFGTFALAYAAHKASSPIRFGPTVALTPLVAKWLGKEIVDDDDDDDDNQGQGDGGASK